MRWVRTGCARCFSVGERKRGMMPKKKGFRTNHLLLVTVVLALALSACQFIKYEEIMRDPAYAGLPKKILVHAVGRNPVVSSEYPTGAGIFEEQLVEQLEERGVVALSSYKILSDPQAASAVEIRQLIEEKGFDTVFIAGPTTRKSLDILRPGEISYAAAQLEGRMEDYDRFSSFVKGSLYSTGTYAGKKVLMELVVYDVTRGRRIWSALSSTYLWDIPSDAVKPMVSDIVHKLSRERIIP